MATLSTQSAIPSHGESLEYLAFTLGQEEYGVSIQKVQELRGYDAVTQIANAPEFIKGVVNLRGIIAVSYTHLRAHETREDLVCRLLLEKKKNTWLA